jgi:hypothetical protein
MPDPTPSAYDRPAPAAQPALEAEVDRMRTRLAEFQRLNSMARMQAVVLVVLIAVMFYIFSATTVARVKANFTDDQVRDAMAKQAPEVVATVTPPLVRAVQASVPTYKEIAIKRLHAVGPEIAADARARMERIPQEQGDQLEKRLQKALDSALARVEKDAAADLPHLTDEQRRSDLATFHHDRIEQANQALAHQVNTMVSKEVVRFDAAIQRLGVEQAAKSAAADPNLAEREFLHNAILLMDDHVMSEDAGVYLPGLAAAMPTKATTQPAAAATTATTAPSK